MPDAATDRSVFRALVRRTLILPIAVLALLAAAIVAIVLHLGALHRWIDHTDQVIAGAHRVQKLFLDAETGLRGYLLTHRPEFLEPYESADRALPGALEDLARLVADNPPQEGRLAALRARKDEWFKLARGRVASAMRDEPVSIPESVEGKARMDGIRAVVQEFIGTEEALRAERSQRADTTATLALWGFVLGGLGLGTALALGGRSQLVSLSARHEEALTAQARQNQVLQAQEWVSRGRALILDELRGELSEHEVCDRLVSSLARYAGAAVGALYTLTDEGDRLELAGTFACGVGEAAPPATLPLGASWVGEVARRREPVRLDALPEGHVRVASATGSSSPRTLALAPLTVGGVPVGVVELGFLGAVEDDVMAFLRTAAEAAGFAIRSARFRARQRALLAATQRQAQDLQQQQEELRVTNEELEEQSRAVQLSQAKLEEQQEELKVTNGQLSDQAARLELQKEELEKAQAALIEKADQLARANRYKSEFLANMSHELRTPLNSSLILSKLLADNKEGNLTPEQVRFAQTISSAGNDLLALINDILDLSRIEAGRVEVKPERVQLADVLESLGRTFQPIAGQRGLTFGLSLEPGAPQAMETDPQRLLQVLKNLLSNAFKFTEHGEVSLRVAASGAARVAFVVRDTGIGIAPEDQAAIFEAFRQVDGSVQRQHGGTGLGLTISRDLARRLGGDIHVESRPGEGSTFSLVVPVALTGARDPFAPTDARAFAPAPVAAPAPAPTASAAARVQPPAPARAAPFPDDRGALTPGMRSLLVVEDDPRFARILYDLAREQRFQCLVAGTCAEALELARRHPPSAIVLDVNLPDGSGLSVLEQLKRSPDTRHVPVHVVSVADETQRALEMGAVGYALKPVQRDELVEAIGRLERKAQEVTRQVLVVEDVEVQRDGLRRLLASEGVQITVVGTAQAALAELRARTFDCMVLDLGLPDMSGYELLERMSADPAFSFPPVIVYTARALSPDEELQLRRYSRSVVIKGARSPERLLDEVTLFIHRVESTLPREQQRMLREARSRDAVLDGRRVLLVDDDVRNVFALTSVLEAKGARVEAARNGREGLDALARARDGGPAPDLVLMDVMMPVMDGLTAIREIRAQEAWRRLPVIALTAKAMPEDRESCLAAGANDYVAKPIDVEKLLSLVRVWMPR